jgi:hypothetical protein
VARIGAGGGGAGAETTAVAALGRAGEDASGRRSRAVAATTMIGPSMARSRTDFLEIFKFLNSLASMT